MDKSGPVTSPADKCSVGRSRFKVAGAKKKSPAPFAGILWLMKEADDYFKAQQRALL
ncbi:MAG: hypothetical protein K8R48_06675 [Alphaproteobacteria bacterium]|nr:hypothetical protein [Alphaproteobacteria bacterium]